MQESEQRHHKDTIHVLSVTNGPGSRKFAEINTKPAVEEQPAPAGAAGGAGAFFPNRGGAAGQGLSPVPFSSHLQPFPASGSSPMSQFFVSGGQSIRVSASGSVLAMTIQD